MSDSTISQLPAASPLTGGELFPVDQGGVTKKATLSMIGYGTGNIVIAGGKTFTVNAALTLNGTDGTSILFPTTSSVMARTDAAQTFTGLQTFTDGITGSQITSTIATGTAPFVVTSTTPVANLSIGGTAANATTAVTLTGLTATIANLNTVTGALGTAAFTATTDYAPAFVSGTQNYFWATPNGSSGVPSLRAIVAADIPTLNQATTANAGTATKLAAAVTIDGVSFDGSANITVIAPATHAATNKTTPVAADELPLYDSVSGLLNKVTFANITAAIGGAYAPVAGNASQVFSVGDATSADHAVKLEQISLLPTVVSAAATDIFGAAGATISIDNSTPVTTTSFSACTSAQVGSVKRVIPVQAWSVTASANLVVDGATSGTFKMPAGAKLEVLASTTTKFEITTIFATGTWVPNQGAGLTVVGAFSSVGTWTKIGNSVTLYGKVIGATSIAVSTNGAISSNLPFTLNASYNNSNGLASNTGNLTCLSYISAGSTTIAAFAALAAATYITFNSTYQV